VAFGDILKLRIEAILASRRLDGAVCSVQALQARARPQFHVDVLALERAGQEGDQGSAGRAVLGVDGIGNELQGSSMFYQNMLEAPSGPNERQPSLASRADDVKNAIRVVVGAARADDDACAPLGDRLVANLLGWNQSHLDLDVEPSLGVLYRVHGRGFIPTRNVPVNENADDRRHLPIV
jgi:hypothetical protein